MHVCMCACIDHVVFMSDALAGQAQSHAGQTIQLMHIRGPTILTYDGPQGPGTMLLKSSTVSEIRGPLRLMPSLCGFPPIVRCPHGCVHTVTCTQHCPNCCFNIPVLNPSVPTLVLTSYAVVTLALLTLPCPNSLSYPPVLTHYPETLDILTPHP